MFLARTVTLYAVLGARPAMVWRNTPCFTVRTSTLLRQSVCRKLELEGSHDTVAEVVRTLVARTHVGPSGASFPTTIVHAASLEDFLFVPIVFTEIR